MRATSNYDEYLVNLASNDLTIEEIASYLGTSTSGMTKCDDPTAPEEGCFQVSGPKYTDLTGPFLKVDEASEYIFEVWIKVQSSTTSTQRFYAGWGMYNSAKSYFGNTRRYWGCSGSQFDSDSNNDGQWHLVRGRISGSGSSTGQFVPGTEYAKFLLLMNYNSGNTVTRYAGMKLYKSREVITSMYLKDSGIDISTGSATDKMLIDTSGNMYPNEVRGSNGNVVIRIG